MEIRRKPRCLVGLHLLNRSFRYDPATSVKLSNRTEYGLRAVVQACPAGAAALCYVQAKDLAKREDLPQQMARSDPARTVGEVIFCESKVGSGGGYAPFPARPADIRVGDLIRRLEGRLTVKEEVRSPSDNVTRRNRVSHCFNERLTDATDAVLDAITLEELLDQIAKTGVFAAIRCITSKKMVINE